MIDTAEHAFDPEQLRELGRIDLIAEFVAKSFKDGVHRSRDKGFSSEFSDYKSYAPGDDLRFLDWRLWARTSKLYVRQFEAETNVEMRLLLDATKSMEWRWQDTINKLEYAVNLLASLAFLHIKQMDRVGLLVADSNTTHYLPPKSGRNQLNAIFAALDQVEPGNANSFPELAATLAGVRRHRGFLTVCSDLEEDQELAAEALKDLASRGDEVVLFHLLDDAEINLPFKDATHLRDSETGELLAVQMDQLRKEHKQTVQDFRQHWRDQCEENGILYLPVSTADNYVEVIQQMVIARQER